MADYMKFKLPSLRVVETMGGYFRVMIHGPDLVRDGNAYAQMDIGRGPTKEAALEQARQWFDGIEDDTPGRTAQRATAQAPGGDGDA